MVSPRYIQQQHKNHLYKYKYSILFISLMIKNNTTHKKQLFQNMVQLLIENGADIWLKNKDGLLPIHIAA